MDRSRLPEVAFPRLRNLYYDVAFCHRNLPDIQEKQGAFKLVRCLTKKHLWPSNFEKMSVARAVAIFSPQVKHAESFYRNNTHFSPLQFDNDQPGHNQ